MSFLIGRRQRFCVHDTVSSWHNVTSGIPQESVLRPVLFPLYINDIPDTIASNVYMFSDGTIIYRPITSGAPWSAANRLHGQRTGAFSWRPVLGLSRKTDQFRLDPIQNCAPGWWCDRESSVYHLALEMYSGIFRHATIPPALSRMLTKHQLHPCPHPTHHSHDYHTQTPTVTNPTAFHAQL